MEKKKSIIGICAILAVLVVVFFATRPGDVEKKSIPPRPEPTKIAKTPIPTPIGTPPTVVPTPIPTPEPAPGPVVKVRVMWKDNGMPVEDATVAMTPLERISLSKEPLSSISGLTNEDGIVTLACPSDTYTSKTLNCRLQVTRKGASSLLYDEFRWAAKKTIELAMERVYEFHGTVYWNPQGRGFVPAPGAEVFAIEADPREPGRPSDPPKMATTFSKADGRYEFQTMPASPLRLFARLKTHLVVNPPDPVMPIHGERSGPFDIYLEPGATLTALVSDKQTLEPIKNATVEAQFWNKGLSLFASTDAEGFCEIAGLPYSPVKIIASASGYATDYAPLRIFSDESSNTVPFFLAKGGRVLIHTVDEKEEGAVGNVEVHIVCTDYDLSTVTDSSGFSLVEGIPLNKNLSLFPTGGFTTVHYARENISMAKSVIPSFIVTDYEVKEVSLPVRKTFSMGDFEASGIAWRDIEGEVVNESGEPIPSALVTSTSSGSFLSFHVSAITNQNGEFTLKDVRLRTSHSAGDFAGSVAPQSVEPAPDTSFEPAKLRVEAAGYGTVRDVSAIVGKKARVVLAREDNNKTTIVVSDSKTKKPILDYWITFPFDLDLKRKETRGVSSRGRTIMEGLPSGKDIYFRIKAEGYFTKDETRKLDASPLEFHLDPQEELKGTVVDSETLEPISGVEVRHSSFAQPSLYTSNQGVPMAEIPFEQSQITDSKGRFSFLSEYSDGSLIFLPKEHSNLAMQITQIKNQLKSEAGEIVIPLDKATAAITVLAFSGSSPFQIDPKCLFLEYLGDKTRDPLPRPTPRDSAYLWEALPGGKYQLKVSENKPNGYRTYSVLFALNNGQHKTMRLGEGDLASFTGHVSREGSEALPDRPLFLLETSKENEQEQFRYVYGCDSDSTGIFSFENIAAGDYQFSIKGMDYSEPVKIQGNTIQNITIPSAQKKTN